MDYTRVESQTLQLYISISIFRTCVNSSSCLLSTEDELQAKAANQSQDAQAYIDQASNIATKASGSVVQVAQNFTACLLKYPLTGFIRCPLDVAASARDLTTAYTSAFSNIFTTGEKILSQIVSSLGAAFQSNLQSASAQFQDIGQNLQKCIEDAAANKTTAETTSE
jgi:hypothetical protein